MKNMETDWRLLNYEGYNSALDGKEFEFKKFKSLQSNDHDHCILCWQMISDDNCNEGEGEGYYCYNEQTKQSNWICKNCFNEFHQKFGWKVKKN